jgi:hypothetical protein
LSHYVGGGGGSDFSAWLTSAQGIELHVYDRGWTGKWNEAKGASADVIV